MQENRDRQQKRDPEPPAHIGFHAFGHLRIGHGRFVVLVTHLLSALTMASVVGHGMARMLMSHAAGNRLRRGAMPRMLMMRQLVRRRIFILFGLKTAAAIDGEIIRLAGNTILTAGTSTRG